MDPTQPPQQAQPEKPEQPTEQPEQTATEYYNITRKRSFLFSRFTVITSMVILMVTLGINIFALASPNTSNIKSNAYQDNPEKNLPSPPAGCSYQRTKKGLAVTCPTSAPTSANEFPVSVVLPKLPPECNLQASESGSMIKCTSPHTPIPTTPVILPVNCITTPQANITACKNNEDKIVAVPLPSLPGGCSYTQQSNKDFISCESK
ncbi:MAG TPA: hypothetical protein VND99_06095 [Candidatus Acidoferrales bacterium]|nr:hypothetical protein [Candidatus Acidoferrales bacterium]